MAGELVVHSQVSHLAGKDPAPQPRPLSAPNGDGFVLLVEDGYSVEQLPGALKNRRKHVFHDVASFAAYLNVHAKDRERCEILVDQTQIVAALDPGSVTGDVMTCELVKDARFEAWSAAFRQPLTQKGLHALIRAQRLDLSAVVADQLLGTLRNLSVVHGGELKIELDETGYTRFAARDSKQTVSGQMPPGFEVTIPVFEGIEKQGKAAVYAIEVFVSIEVVDGKAVFLLEAPSLAAIVRQARRDAAQFLDDQLAEGLLVGLGHFETKEVPAYSTTPVLVPAGD